MGQVIFVSHFFLSVQSYSAQETPVLNVHRSHTHSSTKNSALRALYQEDSGPSSPQRGMPHSSNLSPSSGGVDRF